MKAVDLTQILLGGRSIIRNSGVDAVAHRCEEDHQRAEAIAEDGNVASTIGQFSSGVKGVLNVPNARAPVIGLVQAKAVLPVSRGGDVKVNARLLAPE